MDAMTAAVDFNRGLTALANDPEARALCQQTMGVPLRCSVGLAARDLLATPPENPAPSLGCAAQVIAGVGPTSILGGEWEKAEGRNKDLRELFR